MTLRYWYLYLALLSATLTQHSYGQIKADTIAPIKINSDGKLTYNSSANGDRVPDFSYCGYMLSEVPIPDVPVKVIVPAMAGDATAKLL
jgi:hypothetical protein